MDRSAPRFVSPAGLPDPPGYSHAVWTSGQVAMHADGTAAPPGD